MKVFVDWVKILALAGLASRTTAFHVARPHRTSKVSTAGAESISPSARLLTSKAGDSEDPSSKMSRREVGFVAASLLGTLLLPTPCLAKSYSQNARNFERLNAGDSSGGSTYDNNPSTDSGRKRRAMTGCKISSARDEAADGLSIKSLSEKECNMKIMGGDPNFMLQAMEKLDCPTCPYGVSPKR